jgi:hypothetical protein
VIQHVAGVLAVVVLDEDVPAPATMTLFAITLFRVSNCTSSSTPSVFTTVLLRMTQSSGLPLRRS